LAEHIGLQWAGRWTGPLHEMAHVQFTAGLSLSDLIAGHTIESGIAHIA
jgi:hypothetical protein